MMANGSKIKLRGTVFTLTKMERNMRELGKTTNKMDMAKRFGLMAHYMKENIHWERSKDKGCLPGQMDQNIMVTSWMVALREQDDTRGMMTGAILGSGRVTKWMALAHSHGQMAGITSENISATRKKVMEYSLGVMDDHMRDYGMMDGNTALEHIWVRMDLEKQVSGWMERGLTGVKNKKTERLGRNILSKEANGAI